MDDDDKEFGFDEGQFFGDSTPDSQVNRQPDPQDSFDDDLSDFVHWEYERRRIEEGISPKTFVDQSKRKLDRKTILELIEFDIEFRLSCGESFTPDSYFEEFPDLIPEIIRSFIDVKREFQRLFCPVRHVFGALPVDIGNYRVVEEIGRGGMGVVYLAYSIEEPDQKVAIKVLFVNQKSIFSEAKALQKIKHPNVCGLIEYGKEKNKLPYMVLEYVPGVSLKKKLQTDGRYKPEKAVQITRDICSGIVEAHEQGIVHFDLKLSNILIDDEDRPMTSDFGLAIQVEPDHDWTKTNLFGSLLSMPPEFFRPELGAPGKRSDVYGMGIILYQLLTGTPPFQGRKKEIREQICHIPPPRPSDFEGLEIDEELEDIVMGCLAKRCDQRVSSAEELAFRLDRWLSLSKVPAKPHMQFGARLTTRLIR